MTPGRSREGARARTGWERHTRLNLAVLSCMGLMLALVVALVLAVGSLSERSESTLVAAEEWSAAASNAGRTAQLFDQWEGDGEELRGRLLLTIDELSVQLERLDPEGTTTVGKDLSDLIATARVHLVAPELIRRNFALATTDLAAPFAEVAETLAATGRKKTHSTIEDLDDWLLAIQAAAVLAAVVFGVVVATQILPLSRSINRSTSKLRQWNEQAEVDGRRRTLSRQIVEGLEASVDEPAALDVIARALTAAVPDRAAEMLLADSSQAHLRVAVAHPQHGAPGCGVVSPWSCPAVRRGATQTFDDSTAIRACPHLSKHEARCSAVCAPMTFMGQPMGVLHVTGPVGEVDDELVDRVTLLSSEAATRVGTLRAFAKAELQASTDVLTGLPNRRATESRLRSLASDPAGGTVAMVELRGVAELGDRLGRAAGERALKVASASLSRAVRGGDWCGRWAGAEFVIALPGVDSVGADKIVGRLGDRLRVDLEGAGLAGLTSAVTLVDTRHAQTGHDILRFLDAARREEPGEETEDKILRDQQLSTP